MLIFSTDKPRLQRHFEKDPVKFCYHLGDLDDFYFPYCQWGVDYADRAKIEECILIYSGGPQATVLAFGYSDRFNILLEQMLPLLPPQFHGHYELPSRSILAQQYNEKNLGVYIRYRLDKLKELDNKLFGIKPIRLTVDHEKELNEFYLEAFPTTFFTSRMLESNKYLGAYKNNQLVAVCGVHVDSNQYKIASLGNIVTHPDYRGNGYASALTYHLAQELHDEGKQVCLNVKKDNRPAIAVYEKIGFVSAFEYEEGLFSLSE